MSMNTYASDDYGLLLDDEDIVYIAKRIDQDAPNEPPIIWELMDEIESYTGCVFISEFCGEAIGISDEGEYDYSVTTGFRGETVYFIPFKRYPTLLSAAYKNLDEIISEVRQRTIQYLPPNFDYRNRLRHIVGTYIG